MKKAPSKINRKKKIQSFVAQNSQRCSLCVHSALSLGPCDPEEGDRGSRKVKCYHCSLLPAGAGRGHSHRRQGAVFLGFLLLPGVTEVQGGFVHAKQLTDPVPAIELTVFIHNLGDSEKRASTIRLAQLCLCTKHLIVTVTIYLCYFEVHFEV